MDSISSAVKVLVKVFCAINQSTSIEKEKMDRIRSAIKVFCSINQSINQHLGSQN